MPVPFAALYDIVLGAHQGAGFLLLLIALILSVLAVLSRNQDGLLGHGLVLAKLCGPLFGIVLLTGVYQVIDLGISPLRGWILGALVLGIAYMGVIDGFWRRQAKRIEGGELPPAKVRQICNELAGGGLAALFLMLGAIYLMEANIV